MSTFKQIDQTSNIDKKVVKCGSSLGIIFTVDDLKRFNLKYGDTVQLDNAEILKT
jgi:hypothetical protein